MDDATERESAEPSPTAAAPPGTYSEYRQILEDPNTREALLVQVRGTVGGLRSGYRWHVIASIAALIVMVVAKPSGWVGEQRSLIFGAILLIDILALAALRTVARAPTRFLLPLIAVDFVVVLGLLGLSALNDDLSFTWALLLVLPIMLVVYARDARAIAPILAEHAAYRRTQPGPPQPRL